MNLLSVDLGHFDRVISSDKVTKVILATGKMFIDLGKEALAKNPDESVLLVAIERLYPLQRKRLKHY